MTKRKTDPAKLDDDGILNTRVEAFFTGDEVRAILRSAAFTRLRAQFGDAIDEWVHSMNAQTTFDFQRGEPLGDSLAATVTLEPGNGHAKRK